MKQRQSEDSGLLQNSIRLGVVFLLVAWLVYTLFETVRQVVAYYVPIPVADYWRVVENLPAYQALRVGALWRQHNEHRIIFPEIVFAIDMLAARGRLLLPMAGSFVCYALTFIFLALGVAHNRETPAFARQCAVLLAAVMAFWQGSALVLAQPFLLQWTLTQLAVVLSFLLLTKSRVFAAIVAAVIATYSSANALILWPMLLVIGWTLHLSKRALAALAISSVLFIALYFVGYQFSGQIDFVAPLEHPGYFLGFICVYLSMPFGAIKSPAFGIAVGFLNVAALVLLAACAWRLRVLATSPAVVLFSSYLFTMLTAILTAAGRMDPADPHYEAARFVRYLSVPLLNWSVLLLLLLWMSARLHWRTLNPAALTVLLSLLLVLGTYKLRHWREAYADYFAVWQLAAMQLDAGLTDPQIEARLFPSPEFLNACLPSLKDNRLALFGQRQSEWLGKNLSQFGAIDPNKIAAAVTYSYPVEHGLEIVGWAKPNDVLIILTNERAQIVGWGRRPAAGFPADWLSSQTPKDSAWVAFANLSIPSRTISVFALTRTGLASVEDALPVPVIEAASAQELGAPLKQVIWTAPKGVSAVPRFGWHPSGDVYHAPPAQTVAAEFPAPPNQCVTLPVFHGPLSGGASAQLLDGDDGKLLANFPLRAHDELWGMWRIRVEPTVKHLRFVAQGLTVSTPLECR